MVQVKKPVTRINAWRGALSKEIDAMYDLEFQWGVHDCFLGLTGRVIQALTGTDLVGPWRNRYSTAQGALKVMRSDGFDNLGDLVASILPEIHPSQATIGDIGAIPHDDGFGFLLGMYDGPNLAVLTPNGYRLYPGLKSTRAFKI